MSLVVCDLHKGGVSPIEVDLLKPEFDKAILCGDIADLKNAKNSEAKMILAYRDSLMKKFGPRYPLGNHDDIQLIMPAVYYYIENGIMYTHGHLQMWPEDKVNKWREKQAGSGFLARSRSKIIDSARSIQGKPDQDFFENVYDMIKQRNLRGYVCGHKHYKERITDITAGKTVIVLPRGVHDVII